MFWDFFWLGLFVWILWIITMVIKNRIAIQKSQIAMNKEMVEKWNGRVGCKICNKGNIPLQDMWNR